MKIGDTQSNSFSFDWGWESPQPPAEVTIAFGDDSKRKDTLNENDYGAIKMRLLESMTASQDRRTAGADLYAENLRYSYLIGKDRVSFAESTAQRMIGESGSGKARGLA